jgi:hypothetical protein
MEPIKTPENDAWRIAQEMLLGEERQYENEKRKRHAELEAAWRRARIEDFKKKGLSEADAETTVDGEIRAVNHAESLLSYQRDLVNPATGKRAAAEKSGIRIASIDEIVRIEENVKGFTYTMYFKGGHKPLELNPRSVPHCCKKKPTGRWGMCLNAFCGNSLNRAERFKVSQSLRELLGNDSLVFFEGDTFRFKVKKSRNDSFERQNERDNDGHKREAEDDVWKGKNTFGASD